ncbi:uncharacterized protein LOC135429549 [Drosophila montana]|uniref:uncharacterized protein LOC135429549 n=1 Tax=Drosophila montana TaxID=40370 RepID=UPI00313BE9A3
MDFIPHLLYMFDFVVDDLVITRRNHCAPEEYSTCVELTFRSSVYANICDREYGGCIEPKQPQCGKCCIFALESPITEEDRLLVHVYKKRTDRCKFLIGFGEVKVKPLFDKIDKEFNTENWGWRSKRQDNMINLPLLKGSNRDLLDTCECFNAGFQRLEQLCPSYTMAKRMLPLFNICQQQTGNMVLIMRLLCHGPTIVSHFRKIGNKMVPTPRPADQHPCYIIPAERDGKRPTKGYRYFACNEDKLCPYDICEDEFDRDCPTVPCKYRCKRIVEHYRPCGDCADVDIFPRFASYENLLVKRQQQMVNNQKTICRKIRSSTEQCKPCGGCVDLTPGLACNKNKKGKHKKKKSNRKTKKT